MNGEEAGGRGAAAPDRTVLSVGFIGPLPPTRSGIADYDSEILSSLSENASLSLSISTYEPGEATTALAARHDVLLFQIGNDPLHAPSVEALLSPERRTKAVVVLHDFVLHHLFAAAYLDRGREADYARALEAAHGARGRAFARKLRRGARVPVWDVDPWAFPMSGAVLRSAAAVVVHSAFVRDLVRRENPSAAVVEIPHHVVEAPRTERDAARRALGIPLDRPVAASLGIVTPAKRIASVLEALASLPRERRPFLYVGGALEDGDPLRARAGELGLGADTAFGGYLSEDAFWRAASAADFAINLRHPTMGETSGAVCRLAGFGLPLVVSDAGWFAELPETFAARVPPDAREVENLAAEISRLAFEPGLARRRGAAAAAWGAARRPADSARKYARVLHAVVEGRPPDERRGVPDRPLRQPARRLSVGFVGPFPPVRSGIADYDAELFPALAEVVDARAWQPGEARDALAAGHDVLLFEIGNDPLHAPSVEALFAPERRTPAVVVLHEFVLHHLFAAAYLMRDRERDYALELERAHGARGRAFAESRSRGAILPVWDVDPWAFPMSAGIIRAADAVVAHSILVRGAALAAVPGARVVTIPQHVARAPRMDPVEARKALGLPLDRPVGVTLGIVSPTKRIGKILEALASLPRERRPFFFVGGDIGRDDALVAAAERLGLGEDVRFGGYLTDEDFWKSGAAATFAVNLRHPTMGETSHPVCRLAGLGTPLIVSATGWFRELPDSFADKIPVGGEEVEALAAAMERLAFEPGLAAARPPGPRPSTPLRSPARTSRSCAKPPRAARGREGCRASSRTRSSRSGWDGRAHSARRAGTPTRRSSRRSRRASPLFFRRRRRKKRKIFREGEEGGRSGLPQSEKARATSAGAAGPPTCSSARPISFLRRSESISPNVPPSRMSFSSARARRRAAGAAFPRVRWTHAAATWMSACRKSFASPSAFIQSVSHSSCASKKRPARNSSRPFSNSGCEPGSEGAACALTPGSSRRGRAGAGRPRRAGSRRSGR
jgi:glycosyltransferase involved in cell wall biosynthesis